MAREPLNDLKAYLERVKKREAPGKTDAGEGSRMKTEHLNGSPSDTMVCERPMLASKLCGDELKRWYWLKQELIQFARALGVDASGGKLEIMERVCARLDGRSQPHTACHSGPAPFVHVVRKMQAGVRLRESDLIPGPPCLGTRTRAFFLAHVGPQFHFNGHMRKFLKDNAGKRTMADAIAHWHATKDVAPVEIAAQFEYNRFMRGWKEKKKLGMVSGSLTAREAWFQYKQKPRDT